jgi:hypothetical protein
MQLINFSCTHKGFVLMIVYAALSHMQGDAEFQAALRQAHGDPALVFNALYDLSIRDPEALLLPVLRDQLRLPFHEPPSRALVVAQDPDKCRCARVMQCAGPEPLPRAWAQLMKRSCMSLADVDVVLLYIHLWQVASRRPHEHCLVCSSPPAGVAASPSPFTCHQQHQQWQDSCQYQQWQHPDQGS